MSTASLPINHWPNNACAKAFWGQRELPAYRRLLRHTGEWLDPRPGQSWLDLGCGGGQLTRVLWEKSGGTLAEVIAVDCAAANEKAIDRLRKCMTPPASPQQVTFVRADFSRGLEAFDDGCCDGVVSGLAIQYAESYCMTRNCWTTEAYDSLLYEVGRVLRPGGSFVFSVNVPEPSWGLVALTGVPGFFVSRNPFRYLKNAALMWGYGRWLKKQARLGRFHYLPLETVKEKLRRAGLGHIEHRLSFVGQAYVIRCRKP